ncbi:hypothetical protein EGW08_022463, partial [Elysia chlorotica]
MDRCTESASPSGRKCVDDTLSSQEDSGTRDSISEHLVASVQLCGTSSLLWMLAPFCVVYLASLKADRGFRVWPAARMVLKVLVACLVCVAAGQALTGGQYLDMFKTADLSRLSTFIMVLLVLELKRTNRGVRSLVQYLFWPLSLLATLGAVSVSLTKQEASESPANFLLTLGCLCAVSIHFILARFPQGETSGTDTDQKPAHPEDNASYLSDLLFDWITGIVWKSFRHGLAEEDVPGVNYVDSCQAVSLQFDQAWAIEERKSRERSAKP